MINFVKNNYIMKKHILFNLFFIIGLVSVAQNNKNTNSDGEMNFKWIPLKKGETLLDILPQKVIKTLQSNTDVGITPEGDYLFHSTYTNDGNKILLANAVTNNITVFDAHNHTILKNIEVGSFPYDIAVTDQYAVVSCIFGDQIDIIDLNTMAVVKSFNTPNGAQPGTVKISPDQHYAYISCDVNDQLEIIDLTNMQRLTPITDFPVFLTSWAIAAANNRYSFQFSSFEISSDGSYIIVGDHDDSIDFYNVNTGAIDFSVTGVGKVSAIGLSGDGNKLAAINTDWDTTTIHTFQIDIATHTIINNIDISGHTLRSNRIATNFDGSKIYFGISDNKSALVNFTTNNVKTFTSTYTPFWIGTTYDHLYAVSGQYRFSIIDFENEVVVGSKWGNPQSLGCVSPTEYKVAAYAPLQYEGVLFYEFSNPNSVNLEADVLSGSEPEGDAPYRVAISKDGNHIVSSNALSRNATIINGNDFSIEAIIDLEENSQVVAISPDGNTAVLGGYDLNTIKIIDLNTQTLVKTVYTGQRPMMINISDDNNYAYVGNLKGNSVSIVRLDGTNSRLLTTIPTGIIGLVYTGMGTRSSVVVDPTGQYILVAASFNNKVQIIDINSQSIVKEIAVGNFPLKIAFNDTGDTALVMNYFDDTFNVLHIDGANSYDMGSYSTGGQYPLRVAYDKVNDRFGIIHSGSKTLREVASPDWTSHYVESYSSLGTPIQVRYDNLGKPIVLVMGDTEPGYLTRDGETTVLPATPNYFDFCESKNKAVVCMPGPDYLSVVDYSVSTIDDIATKISRIYPNPSSTDINIDILDSMTEVKVAIYTTQGIMVKNQIINKNQPKIDVEDLQTGIYFIQISEGNRQEVYKFIKK